MDPFNILFVDDDRDILDLVNKYLSRFDYSIRVVDNAMEALDLVMAGSYDIVFTDYKMPEVDGLELLSAIKEYRPETIVVIVTGHGTMESAIEAMRFGSYDYIQKPFKLEVLKLLIDRVREEKNLEKEGVRLRSRVKPRHGYDDLVGMNLKMQEIYEIIDRMRDQSPHVMIQGEIGTGKELTANVIHRVGNRRAQPFITVKSSALAGGEKGKTAVERLEAAVASADGGTLFIDEITEVPSAAQVALLQVASSAGRRKKAGVRVIGASARDLNDVAAGNAINADLLKCLGTIRIKMPPLRERKEDICPLLVTFIDRFNRRSGGKLCGFSVEVMDVLLTYPWPGNLIQLENVVERAVAMGVEGTIELKDLPADIRNFSELSKKMK